MPQRQHFECTVPGCDRPHKAAGLCQTHYMQTRRGEPVTEIKARDRTPHERCKEEGCTEPVKAKGLCKMHHQRLLRHGHTMYRDRKKPTKPCSMPDCEDIRYAKGLCHRHYLMHLNFPKKYGISLGEYMRRLEDQRHVCAICQRPESITNGFSGRLRKLAVDHCHGSGRIRGLLCSACNTAIGLLGDDPTLLKRALAYLKKGAS